MSHLSPSHDQRHLQEEEQEQQQRELGAESFHAQNPKPNINSSDLPRNQPALPSQTGSPISVETHVPELRLSRDHPLLIEAQISEDQEAEDLESEGMPLSPTPQISCTDRRRGAKRRKGLLKGRQRQMAIEKKLQMLNKNLNPIPFVPIKILDFSKHEELLKRLGLWEFAHIEFDKNLRADLIALLIAGYSSKDRCSFVYDGKIPVNRADLGRALNLPVKKSTDCGVEAWPEDFVSFVDEFVSTWMLLHDDTWMMPEEVLAWTKSIKVGQLEKVDWPGLIWFMVEKELTQGSKLGDCYYASHLQHLIKMNREDLLRGKAKENEEADIVQVDEEDDGKMVEGEDLLRGKAKENEEADIEADGKMVEGEDLLRGKAKENEEADIVQVDEEADGKMVEGEDLLRGKAKENEEADIVQVDEEADGKMVEGEDLLRGKAKENEEADIVQVDEEADGKMVEGEDLLRGKAKENEEADIVQVDEEADGKIFDGEDLLRGKAKENEEADIVQVDEEADGKMVEGEDLLRGKAKENEEADIVQVDEEADGKMVESQVSDGGAKVVDRKITVEEGTKVEQNTSLFLGQNALDETAGADAVSDMEIVHSAANTQLVDMSDDLKKEDHSIDLQNICDVDENQIDNAENVESADNACKVDNVENDVETDEFENADGNSNTVTASGNAFADDIKNVDTNDDVRPEVRGEISFESSPRDEPGQWLFGGKRGIGEPFLRSCSMAEETISDKPLTKDREGGEQVEGLNDMQSCNALEEMVPGSLMQAIEAEQMPYSSSNFCDQSSLELLSTRHETNAMMVGPTIFGNAPKREAAHAPDISHSDLGDNHKRMRVEAPWDSKPVDFELCVDQLQQWAGKAKIASRERDRQHANMQQFFVNELENKERIIQQLQTGFDELQRRRQAELNRLENELYVMSGLIDGYRRAIKDTQGAFAEYRKRCPQADEPIYQDAGCGGVVKSVRELEEERQRREEEERMLRIMVEEFVRHADKKWNSDMERYHAQLQLQQDALTNLEEEAVHLRGSVASP